VRSPAAAAGEEIPILDLGPYLAGEWDALERLGAELQRAFQEIGFYFIRNHGVPQRLGSVLN
jgi:isopenicillin N synthase-like dioxygenase